jgi:hypothetical protein
MAIAIIAIIADLAIGRFSVGGAPSPRSTEPSY